MVLMLANLAGNSGVTPIPGNCLAEDIGAEPDHLRAKSGLKRPFDEKCRIFPALVVAIATGSNAHSLNKFDGSLDDEVVRR